VWLGLFADEETEAQIGKRTNVSGKMAPISRGTFEL
jgi:hypothetical protein